MPIIKNESTLMDIPFSPPDISEAEIQNVVSVLKSGWITTGPKTKEFEKHLAQFINTDKVCCLNSATAALETTLRILGIGEGDEVIVPAYTYTASCSVICHVGAKPVMIDTIRDSLDMDLVALERAINERTKAIIAVDIGGVLCDYESILKIVDLKRSLFVASNDLQKAIGRCAVISDSAHALGATRAGIMSGNFADFTCFSFHAVKNLTTAEGGAVTWNPALGLDNDALYQSYMLASLHGQTKDALNKTRRGSWEYDIVYPSYKCNMTDIQAAIGLAQLERYPDMLAKRRSIVAGYEALLSNFNVAYVRHINEETNSMSSCHLFIMRLLGASEKDRNLVIDKLAQCGVATNVHYKPLPMLTAYKNLGFNISDFPNAYNYYKNEITLPLFSTMSEAQFEYISTKLNSVLGGLSL